jgi:hypothetical protein
MTSSTPRQVTVVARPGALAAAAGDRSVYAIAKEITAHHPSPARATINNIFARPGYRISKDKAEVIADALGMHVTALFVHLDGAPLA